jgi:SAM-dependent methyltransferase
VSDAPSRDEPGIDYARLYAFRFRRIDQESRQAVWNEIARYLYGVLGEPQQVLEPGAGRREFISAIPATDRWVVDTVDHAAEDHPDIHTIIGDARTVELPDRYFDGVFVSNLLEHFTSQEDIGAFLQHLRRAMAPGGRIAVLGPNFRYCAKEYFDCADHTLALTHLAVEEHLYAAGFEIQRSTPRFLPYSFRGRFPRAPALVRAYLAVPLAWRLLGKQFLVVATTP